MAAKAKKGFVQGAVEGEIKGGPRGLLEDLFEDYYKHRKRLYFMNLIRGLFFGFGSVIGGTVVVALLLWVLSLFDSFPFLNEIFKSARDSVENRPR